MDSQRLVSVVIAVSRTEFFETALRSVIAQSCEALEIVVCDDTSFGLAEAIVDQYRPTCPWPIRFARIENLSGENASLLRAVQEAEGHYLKFLADDAVMAPDCIAQMVAALESTTNARLVSAHRQWLDADGHALAENLSTRFRVTDPTVFRGPDVVALLGEFTCNFIGELSSVLCRRTDVVALGKSPFSINAQSLGPLGDLALYAKLLREGDLILLPDTLTGSRVAPRHITDQGLDIVGATTEYVHLFHRLIREAGWASTSLENGWVATRALHAAEAFSPLNLRAQLSAPLPQRLNPEQVQAWLDYRTPNAEQQRQLREYLEQNGVPSLLVLVQDHSGNPQRVQRSLDSLDLLNPLFAHLQVVVASDASGFACDALGTRLSQRSLSATDSATLLNQVIEDHTFDWLLVIDAGTEFTAFGLSAFALKLLETPDCRAAFADEMYRNPKGEMSSAMRPDFNLDYLLSYPLASAGHWLFRRQMLLDAGGFDPQFSDAAEFDMILRLIEREGASVISHVVEPLLVCALPEATHNQHEIDTLQRHLGVRGYPNAKVLHTLSRRYHVQYGHTEQPLVSIIIPTKDQLPLLQRCVETLLHKTSYPHYEVLILDNNTSEPNALAWLAGIEALGSEQVRVLRHPFPFNYSEINNVGAAHARGEYLVLLNNDTAVVHERWLDEMLNHALRPEVGTVGAKLLFPNGRLQHAGVRMGMDGPAGHQHIGEPQHIQGYMQRVQVDQDLSAVTAACLMVRRSVFQEVGGLDETAFVVSYNDVDLCLKVGAQGYLNVWTPHAVLIHEGSVSQTNVDTASHQAKRKRFVGEQLAMYRKWMPTMVNDSAFNANLSFDLQSVELELNMQLVWRPLSWRPQPVVLAYPEALWASPHERMIAPFQQLQGASLLDGVLSHHPLSIVQEARFKPDVMLFQARVDADQVQVLARTRALQNSFIVLDLSAVQLGADNSADDAFAFSAERVELLQQSLQQVDRVIASTAVLADIAREFHSDVRLLPSRLPLEAWGDLKSGRGRGSKPRVGLVSDQWQAQDLFMIQAVVKALADEVEWVVMGDHHAVLRELSHEWHELPGAEQYPAALAALDLDLGLLPAVDNLFSACKGNLGLLQLGSCAIPVVCSEVRAYEGDLPVTRVPNTLEGWTGAIRAHIQDLPSAGLLGEQLRERVRRDWMLDEAAIQAWREAWLP